VKVAGYDANVRSPLIFSMPGKIPAGTVCEVPVSGVDIPATIFKFTGVTPPWEIHGHDLSPLLKNPKAPWPHTMLMAATGQKFGSAILPDLDGKKAMHAEVPYYVMIRDKNLKYVRPLITDLEELYDLDADPEELNNLAVAPAHKATLVRMRARAMAELKRTKANLVDRMPPVREVI
jgi:arylsulfatase A-like enzyme